MSFDFRIQIRVIPKPLFILHFNILILSLFLKLKLLIFSSWKNKTGSILWILWETITFVNIVWNAGCIFMWEYQSSQIYVFCKGDPNLALSWLLGRSFGQFHWLYCYFTIQKWICTYHVQKPFKPWWTFVNVAQPGLLARGHHGGNLPCSPWWQLLRKECDPLQLATAGTTLQSTNTTVTVSAGLVNRVLAGFKHNMVISIHKFSTF